MTTPGRAHIRWFRNTAPYINAHRGKTFVLMLGGEVAQHANFPNIIHDIALLNSLGVRLVIIHGSRPQIAARLEQAGLASEFHEDVRITDTAALEHVKDAAGSLRAPVHFLHVDQRVLSRIPFPEGIAVGENHVAMLDYN